MINIFKKNYFYASLITLLSFQPFMFLLGLIPHKNPIEGLFVYIIGFLGTLHIVILTLLFLFLSLRESTKKTRNIKNNLIFKIITLFLVIFNIIISIGPSSLRKERDNQIQLYKYRIQESRY